MIRHVHNAAVHSIPTARPALRQTAPTTAETNPFRSILQATATTPAPISQAATGDNTASTVAVTATITKSAAPTVAPLAATTVTLGPPVYKQGATVTNPDGSTTPLNWTQFAAPETAQQIAAKLGGAVDEANIAGFSDSQLSIRVPGSNNLVNAGVAAQLFAQYGDKQGSQAWQIINRDLGRDPMST